MVHLATPSPRPPIPLGEEDSRDGSAITLAGCLQSKGGVRVRDTPTYTLFF